MLPLVNRAPQSLRTYFLTFVTAHRRRLFQGTENANLMLDVLQHYRSQNKYQLHAFVIMPDHVHVLLTPAEYVSLERVMQLIKGGFSFRLKSKMDVWERGHFGKRLGDSDAFTACIRYIEDNPVRAKIVNESKGYTFSSSLRKDVDPCPGWLM